MLLYNFILSNGYTIVLSEENNPVSDITLNEILEKSDSSEDDSLLFNYNENILMDRQVKEFFWDGVKCSFDNITGILIIGGGEISSEYMLDKSPFKNSALYPLQPEDIEHVIFKDKIKFNGSANSFFSMNRELTSIENLNNIDTSNVTDMSRMFYSLKLDTPIDISTWDTSSVATMEEMFGYVGNSQRSAEIILNTESNNDKLTNINRMFYSTYFPPNSDIGSIFQDFDTKKVGSMNQLFASANNINILDLSNASMENIKNGKQMFDGADIRELILPAVKPELLVNMDGMFQGLQVESLDCLEQWDTSDVVSMNDLFRESNLKIVPIQNFDMSSVENSSYMFAEMSKLEFINFGENFNTKQIIDMSGMFSEITYKDLDLSFFDTSSVITLDDMFVGSKIDSLNLSGWNNPKLESMDSTFSGGSSPSNRGYIKEINLTDFNTANVKNMDFLFYNAENIENFDFSSLEVSSVTSMAGMFRASSFEEFDFSTWDTSNVTDMSEMFSGDVGRDKVPVSMNLTKLDLSELNTESLDDSYRMFANLNELEELNLASFHTLDKIDAEDMFVNCTSLAKIELSKNSNNFPEDTNLPEIDSSSKYPTSWLSEKSNLFFENTPDFISGYKYTLNDGSNEVMIRSFKYTVEYVVEDNIIFSEEYLYNQLVEIPDYFNNRYEVLRWVNADTEASHISGAKESNIGVDKTSYGKIVRLDGHFSEREIDLTTLFWENTRDSLLDTSIDVGEDRLEERISATPLLEFNQPTSEKDKLVSYKIETYDSSNNGKNLINTSYETFEINQNNDFLYNLLIGNFPEGSSSIDIEFYQLSVINENIEEKEPIKNEPSGKLSIRLLKDRSFSILSYTNVLRWDVRESNSKGILSRDVDNELEFLILNSLYPDYQWDISLSMQFPDDLPFKFIWKENKEDEGIKIDKNTPITIINKNDAESIDKFKYQKNFGRDAGVLIKSDSILPSADYSKDVKLYWILSSHPNFD